MFNIYSICYILRITRIGVCLMDKKLDRNMVKFGVVLTISICVCLTFAEVIKEWRAIFAFLGKVGSAMAPFVVGLVLAFLLNPIMVYFRRAIAFTSSKLLKKVDYDTGFRKSKTPALILTIVFFFVIIGGFLRIVIPHVYMSLQDLVDKAPGYLENAQNWLEKFFKENSKLEAPVMQGIEYVRENVMGWVQDKIMPNLDDIVVKVSSGLVVGVKAIFNFLVGIIFTIYLLASKDVLIAQGKKIVYCTFSKKTGNKILSGLTYANSVFGGFINGKILDSVIIGFMCYAFTEFIDMQYAVLISVIVGVTNIIPFFGPFIGAIPGALLALMDDPIYLFIFVVFILLLQQFDGNILGPLILGDSTGLSGMWVLGAILVGGDLFGVAGMVFGVPVFACIYAFIAVQLRDGLREKNLSSKTEDYFRLKGFDEETGEPIYRKKHDFGKPSVKKRKKKSLFKRLKERYNKGKDAGEAMMEDGGDTISEEKLEEIYEPVETTDSASDSEDK